VAVEEAATLFTEIGRIDPAFTPAKVTTAPLVSVATILPPPPT